MSDDARRGEDLDRLTPPFAPPPPAGAPPAPGEADVLPPPAFGSGARPEAEGSDDAFIDPDEPIVRTHAPHPPADYAEVVGAGGSQDDDVRVTGIGDDDHTGDEGPAETPSDPDVAELVARVGALADALRTRGEAGLRAEPGMTGFEASLRAYCVGWLAARREGGKG